MGNDHTTGAISWMARNSVAANLLMFLIVVAGAIGGTRVIQEVFPSFELDIITVSAPYPGASPEEVEDGMILAVEEAVRGIDGVKKVKSTAAEGAGAVQVELFIDADRDKALADVKTAVDRIMSFPEEMERPRIQLLKLPQEVISVMVTGDQEISALHGLAEALRTQLIQHEGITQVELKGVPARELAIEVPRAQLEGLGLSLDQVAGIVATASLDLPAGGVDTPLGEVLVRVADRKDSARTMGQVVLKGSASGSTVTLGDVAKITDGYATDEFEAIYNGKAAVMVTAYRVGKESPIDVAKAVRDVTEGFRAGLGDEVSLDYWNDGSELLQGRIDLLVRNGRLGLVLVLLILALFLNLRLAFWISLGIPISFLGNFLLMPMLDVSINMISLFGLIVTLGMVVDDAIVVGEAAYKRMEDGDEPMDAAIKGAREMCVPVTFAVLTTIAAFSPMFGVPGFMGKLFRILPSIITAVLIFSLIESFFILPAHLAHTGRTRGRLDKAIRAVEARVDPVRLKVSGKLTELTASHYRPFLALAIRWRYTATAIAFSLLLLVFGVVKAGMIPFSFLPDMEGELIQVSARLPYGAPIEDSRQVQASLEEALGVVLEEFGEETVRGRYATVGSAIFVGGPAGNLELKGSHLTSVLVWLVGSDARDYSAREFADRWSELTPEIVGLEALRFESAFGPHAGAAVHLQLQHNNTDVLAQASADAADLLRGFTDLTEIENSYAEGKPQLDFKLKPAARTLGLTSMDLARQLRAAFHGAEAYREQQGRDEVKVIVRLPASERVSEHDLAQFRVRTPTGGFAALHDVADLTRNRAPTSIQRENGTRTVDVTSKLAPGIASSSHVVKVLKDGEIQGLMDRHPGLAVEFAGEQQEQAETFAALGQNYLIALLVMFGLLAVPFRSYIQPLVIMSAIPFGIVGAIIGHIIMGYGLSMISVMGIVALSGVVVNDSLVLVDAANRYRREGHTALEAIQLAGARRMRPILLTSMTTFFGLAPMITETSLQAKFLIPMAISLGFGVIFATQIILVLVPCFFMIVEDIKDWWEGPAAQVEVHLDPIVKPTPSTDLQSAR